MLVHYFEFTDRVQHMMFRFFDPKHPLYTPEGGGEVGRLDPRSLPADGRDRRRGDAEDAAGTRLIVVSDHGFASFRRGMNYNTWLAKNGYMTLTGEDAERKNLEDLFDQGDFFVNVDWSKTRAYALGLGQIYVNLEGPRGAGHRQARRRVRAALAAEIKAGLEAFVDEETGEQPVAHVFTRDEAYGTYDPELIPDLIPSNNDGYRVGWQDSLGGIAKAIVEPNTEIWSGDHCSVYPPLVEGILFSNRSCSTTRAAYMGDVMPTMLELYGVQPTAKLDGRSLLEEGRVSQAAGSAPSAHLARRRARWSLAAVAPCRPAAPAPAPVARAGARGAARRDRSGSRRGLARARAARRVGLRGELAATDLELELQARRLAEAAAARDLAEQKVRRRRGRGGAAGGGARGQRGATSAGASPASTGSAAQGYLRLLLSMRPAARGACPPSAGALPRAARPRRDRPPHRRPRAARGRAARAPRPARRARDAGSRARAARRRDLARGPPPPGRRSSPRAERERGVLAARAGDLERKVAQLAELLDLLYGRNPERLAGRPIQRFRGVLDWPVRGDVIAGFGPRLDPRYRTRVPHNGVVARHAAGAGGARGLPRQGPLRRPLRGLRHDRRRAPSGARLHPLRRARRAAGGAGSYGISWAMSWGLAAEQALLRDPRREPPRRPADLVAVAAMTRSPRSSSSSSPRSWSCPS